MLYLACKPLTFMNKLPKAPLIFLVLFTALSGCTKKGDDTSVTTEHVHEFSGETSSVVGDTVYFKPVYPKGKTYRWDFGDGVTSGAEAPGHAYKAPGTYTVKLVVDGNMDLPVVSTILIYAGPFYTDRIAKSWLWRHNGTMSNPHGSNVNFTRPDTAFSIGYFSKSKLNIGCDTLRFNYFSGTRIYFSTTFTGLRPGLQWQVAYDTASEMCFMNRYQYNADSTNVLDFFSSY
jgi:hypothetical protein